MLKHYVIFKFEDNFFTDENLKEYKEAFSLIEKEFEGIRKVEIQKNMIDRPANFDLMIIMDLDGPEVLGQYLNHPEHVRMGQKYNPHVTNRVSFDYEG